MYAWLAGPKNPRAVSGQHRQSHTPAEQWPGSVTSSSCPDVTQLLGGQRPWTLAFASCSCQEQGQAPAYGHGESRASHSLIEEQQGGSLTCGVWRKTHAKTNSSTRGKSSRCCRTHLLLMGLREGQAGNADSFGIRCFWQGRITRLHHGSPLRH